MTNSEFLSKFDSGGEFSEQELKEMSRNEFPDGAKYIDEEEGEDHRWQRDITTIFSVEDRFFALEWMRGLTERQDNDYWKQPYEVEKHQYEKTITVTKWERVQKASNGGKD